MQIAFSHYSTSKQELRNRCKVSVSDNYDKNTTTLINESMQRIQGMQERLNRDQCEICVVGEFKNGKSTLINALLGGDFLCIDEDPCTSVITKVSWPEIDGKKKARIHIRSELNSEQKLRIPTYVDPTKQNFFEIDLTNVDQLKEFIAMDSGRTSGSPYSTVELFWPIPILERGLVIVDCPGLN